MDNENKLQQLLKRAPVHYRLFGKKPKDGLEWIHRIHDVGMYLLILVAGTYMQDPDLFVRVLKNFGVTG